MRKAQRNSQLAKGKNPEAVANPIPMAVEANFYFYLPLIYRNEII